MGGVGPNGNPGQRPSSPGGVPGPGAGAAAGAKLDVRVIPFGKYLLLDRMAVGGMAEVYTAKSFGIEGFEKIIAIKRILPTMAEDEDFIQMFIDEAKIAGHLTHANIAPIYELGKIGDSHYIAMEYVWGKDLLQLMNRFRKMRKQMPPVMGAWIGAKMCEGLDYAHRKKDRHGRPLNIIHRDVSPQNCLVSYEGQVKVIDFGIAKAASRNTKTQAGVLKGKFGYMSPEQVRGLPVDHRSDVFAVGTCMYEMLTSERLFVGESDFTTLEKVRNATVTPLSQMIPDMPAELDQIVMKALTREVADRWQSAAEMQEALQVFISKERPPFGTSKLSAWMRTAFAAEIAKEKGRLDLFAKVGPPPSVPPPPPARASAPGRPPPPPQRAAAAPPDEDEEPAELTGESTMISSSPFDEMMEGGGPTGSDDLIGQATQIFFSADDADEVAKGPEVGNFHGGHEAAPAHSETMAAPPPGPAPPPALGQNAVAIAAPMRVVGGPMPPPGRPPAGVVPLGSQPAMPPPQFGQQPQQPPPQFGQQPQFGAPQPPQFGQPQPPPQFGQPQAQLGPAPGQQPLAPQDFGGPPAQPGGFPGAAPPQRNQETMELRVPTGVAPPTKRRGPVVLGVLFGTLAVAALAVIGFLFMNRPQVGAIEIRTMPADVSANVLVDGTVRGRAPLRLENVAAGPHEVTLQADGFQTVSQTVSVRPDFGESIVVPLTPLVPGLVVAGAPTTIPAPVVAPPVVPPVAPPPVDPTVAAATVAPTAPVVAPPPVAPVAPPVVAPVAPPAPPPVAPPPTTTTTTTPRTTTTTPPTTTTTPRTSTTTPPSTSPTPRTSTTTTAPRTSTTVTPPPTTPAPSTGPRRIDPDDVPTRTPTPERAPRTSSSSSSSSSSSTSSASGSGFLMIQTLPWARVFLDGRDTGRNTPVRQLRVSAGSHRIGLRTTDGAMHEETVVVPAGETVRIVRQL